MIPVKTCTRCNIVQALHFFSKDKSKKDGFWSHCKACDKIYKHSKKGRLANKKYSASEKGKKKISSYRKSEARKLVEKRYLNTEKGKAKVLAKNNRRRAARIRATPPWLSKDHLILMEMDYQRSVYLSNVVGIPFDVDHIYPLQGENSCGLHVPWNLRVIPADENGSKGNKLP